MTARLFCSVLIGILLAPTAAWPCSCAEVSFDREFVGCALSRTSGAMSSTWTFEVLEDGPDYNEGDRVKVRDGQGLSGGNSCAVGYEKGVVYRVGVHEDGSGWSSDGCTGTTALEDDLGQVRECETGCRQSRPGGEGALAAALFGLLLGLRRFV